MSDFLSLIFATALLNNIVLVHVTGVSALFAFSTQLRQALDLALVSVVILGTSIFLASLLDRFLLKPLGLEFLRLLCFLAISSALATLLATRIRQKLPVTARRGGACLLLAGANSAVIGGALILSESDSSLIQSLAYSLGYGLGFALLLIAFAAFRQRLDSASVPAMFRGPAVELISAGLVALALSALSGAS